MCDVCGDNRFEIIKKAKEKIIRATNIDGSPDEMKVLDNILFRCWQMGWLDEYDDYNIEKKKQAVLYLEELKNGLFGHCRSSYLKDKPEELEEILKVYEKMYDYIRMVLL